MPSPTSCCRRHCCRCCRCRSSPFNYKIELAVPESSESRLHPYMSVVIGVIAAIVLCLFFTLSRRVFMRHSMFAGVRNRLGVSAKDLA